MSNITYKALRDKIRRDIWPPEVGEARNQVGTHNTFFLEAFLALQHDVECLQRNNTSPIPHCSTYIDLAKTVVDAPVGKISAVYTIANGNWDNRVYYRSANYAALDSWAREMRCNYRPATPVIHHGIRLADATTDVIGGRARTGVWAIRNKRLYAAPWIQSNETLVLEWDGVRSRWAEDDMLDELEWDLDAQEALRLAVMAKHEGQFGCDRNKANDLRLEYNAKLADLIYRCNERTRQQDEPHPTPRWITSEEYQDEQIAVALPDEIYFANIGDFGSLGHLPGVLNVSNLVKGKAPQFIVTNGDNDYDGDFDQTVGQFYSDYLFPYTGEYSSSAVEQMMFPVPGNHDWDVDETLEAYLSFFNLERRYYEFVKGPVHFFMMSTDSREPDGRSSTSVQAKWLQARMALSTAHWKIVVVHDPPYTSSSNDAPGHTTIRWPFKAWGADLVLSGDGHHYERFEVDALPYIVNGAGGRALRAFTATPTTGSLARYNADWGAGFCRVTCDQLVYEFFNTAGTLIDTLTISK